jgi:Right handed beta helix region
MKYLLLMSLIFLSSKSALTQHNQNQGGVPGASYDIFANEVDSLAMDQSPAIDTARRDTIHIGPDRLFKTLEDYFVDPYEQNNVCVIMDEGDYYTKGIWVLGDSIVIEGKGTVNLFCTEMGGNVMWITGNNVVIRNIRMKHFAPGEPYNRGCSGSVIAFEHAHHVLIENCDLNGCGLSGLHDNLNNSDIVIRNCAIHNNSIGAYTNIKGGVWLKPVKHHRVFTFENNQMYNNGPGRIMEFEGIDDYIVRCEDTFKLELESIIRKTIEEWKDVPTPFVAVFNGSQFVGPEGKVYDFAWGSDGYTQLDMMQVMENNPDGYINRSFIVSWQWAVSTIPVPSAEYEYFEAYMPSIVSLKLMKGKKIKNR